jgi:WD40 repeat protein
MGNRQPPRETAVGFACDENTIFLLDKDGKVFWEQRTDALGLPPIKNALVMNNTTVLIIVEHTLVVYLFDILSGNLTKIESNQSFPSYYRAKYLRLDDTTVIADDENGLESTIFDVKTGEKLSQRKHAKSTLRSINKIVLDSNTYVVVEQPNKLTVWDVQSELPKTEIVFESQRINATHLYNSLLCVCLGRKCILFNTSTEEHRTLLEVTTPIIQSVVVGKYLAIQDERCWRFYDITMNLKFKEEVATSGTYFKLGCVVGDSKIICIDVLRAGLVCISTETFTQDIIDIDWSTTSAYVVSVMPLTHNRLLIKLDSHFTPWMYYDMEIRIATTLEYKFTRCIPMHINKNNLFGITMGSISDFGKNLLETRQFRNVEFLSW